MLPVAMIRVRATAVLQRELLGVTVESFRTLKTENDLLKERVAALESGRQPRISGFSLNGVGFAVGGLATEDDGQLQVPGLQPPLLLPPP